MKTRRTHITSSFPLIIIIWCHRPSLLPQFNKCIVVSFISTTKQQLANLLALRFYSPRNAFDNNAPQQHPKMFQRHVVLFLLSLFFAGVSCFGVVPPAQTMLQHRSVINGPIIVSQQQQHHVSTRTMSTELYMSSLEKTKTTKKGVKVIDKTETKAEEQKKKEEMWRVVLHNDEVHTFNYVIRSLTKVVGTLDRKAAFEICVQTHGIGKATITKTWKKQAEQFCLGLQRQGLTVSISPDKDFEGGHSGGGL